MKKTYLKPVLKAIEEEMEQDILEVSSVGLNPSATPIDPSGADARGFSDWDDEE